MKLFTKAELVETIEAIANAGWHKSTKATVNFRNDGAVGNTLESLLGITENNLPIPNAAEWELKGQRLSSASLITLKHKEPSPTALRFVPGILLPKYGWPHKAAGSKYAAGEMSFRSTTSANVFTIRGFGLVLDRREQKLKFVFDSTKANKNNPEILAWLKTVEMRAGLGPLDPEPYWGFDDLNYSIGEKIKNCFYVVADNKTEASHEYFRYIKLFVLEGFSFEKFLACIDQGHIFVDFDARSGHNHGTKFRLKGGHWTNLYEKITEVPLLKA